MDNLEVLRIGQKLYRISSDDYGNKEHIQEGFVIKFEDKLWISAYYRNPYKIRSTMYLVTDDTLNKWFPTREEAVQKYVEDAHTAFKKIAKTKCERVKKLLEPTVLLFEQILVDMKETKEVVS